MRYTIVLIWIIVLSGIGTGSASIVNPVTVEPTLNFNLVEGVDYEPAHFIVKLTSEANQAIQRSDGSIRTTLPSLDQKLAAISATAFEPTFPFDIPPLPDGRPSELSRMYTVTFAARQSAMAAAAELTSDANVEYAHPFYTRHLAYTPNDAMTDSLWYLDEIRATQAWNLTRGNKNVVIAIVDTGVDWDHPDLAANIYVNPGEDVNGNGSVDDEDFNGVDDDGNGLVDDIRGYDFVDGVTLCDSGSGEDCNDIDNDPMDLQGHGSHCAGDASAVGDNYVGLPSVGFSCSIMPLRNGYLGLNLGILQFSIDGDASYQAVAYAGIMGADVISCSWGGGEFGQAEQDVMTDAFLRGSVIVAAAGNGSTPSQPDVMPQYPAAYENVIAVAATGGTPGAGANTNRKADFTTYGPWVDIATPGVDIWSTVFNNQWISISGTSMATPITAGALGLIRAVEPDFTAQQIVNRLLDTANYDALYNANPQQAPDSLGVGLLDVYAAVSASGYAPGSGEDIRHLGQNYPNPFNPATTLFYTLDEPARVTLTVFDAAGRRVDTVERDVWKTADHYRVEWQAPAKLSSGVYIYQLEAHNVSGQSLVEKRRMVLLK